MLHVKGVISSHTTLRARSSLLHHLATHPHALALSSSSSSSRSSSSSFSIGEGLIGRDEKGKYVEGWTVDAETGGQPGGREGEKAAERWREVGESKEVAGVYKGKELHQFFFKLFSQGREKERETEKEVDSSSSSSSSSPFHPFSDCTWLRMKGSGEVTAEHTDYY